MASLKEVNNRIKSVTSTRKITSAMKMVASSKLHHAQMAIENMLPYQEQLNAILQSFGEGVIGDIQSLYSQKREIEHVAIIAVASNSSLCGAFNANIQKALTQKIKELNTLGIKQITVIPIGNKIAEKAKKLGYAFESCHSELIEKPNFKEASALAQKLMEQYVNKEIDQIFLIYNHFVNTAKQQVHTETYLPINISAAGKQTNKEEIDFIIEPSVETLFEQLIPKVLHLNIFTALLDSCASEHSARVVAMQTATDNADDLLKELTLTYNKTRQAAITAELLDIVGGTFK